MIVRQRILYLFLCTLPLSAETLNGLVSYLEVLKSNIEMTKASLASLAGTDHIGTLQRVEVKVRKPHYAIGDMMHKAQALNRVKVAEYNVKKADKGIEKSQTSLCNGADTGGYEQA